MNTVASIVGLLLFGGLGFALCRPFFAVIHSSLGHVPSQSSFSFSSSSSPIRHLHTHPHHHPIFEWGAGHFHPDLHAFSHPLWHHGYPGLQSPIESPVPKTEGRCMPLKRPYTACTIGPIGFKALGALNPKPLHPTP